jgi:iron(II)-dependent oxidoreductase
MAATYPQRGALNEGERKRRRTYLAATLVTCVALAMLGGTLHVLKLGANRIADMRGRAAYDVAEVDQHVRAAGEDLAVNRRDEPAAEVARASYSVAEADALLTPQQWQELGTMITIPAGDFLMGTDRERSDAQDRPQHRVNVAAYRIDKYLVTNAQYARFVAATGHRPPMHWENGRIPPGWNCTR